MGVLALRLLPYFGAAVIAFGCGYWLANTRAEARYKALEAGFLQYKVDAAEIAARAADEALAREQAQIRRNQEIELAKQERDARITVLQRDVERNVRDVRLCHSARRPGPGRVPEAGSASRDTDASAERELPESTIPDIVTLAADADRIVSQLEMCQAWAQSIGEKFQ